MSTTSNRRDVILFVTGTIIHTGLLCTPTIISTSLLKVMIPQNALGQIATFIGGAATGLAANQALCDSEYAYHIVDDLLPGDKYYRNHK